MKSLIARDASCVWHPYTQMKTARPPLGIVRGRGAWIFDEQGKGYIDAVSSWWVTLHGHAHPVLAKAIADQACLLEQVIFAGCTHEPAVTLAESLLSLLPSRQKRVFYTDDGSTAVEVALKMVLQFWHNQGVQKTKILALEGAYHGDTFGAMSVSGRSAFNQPFEQLLFDVQHLPFPSEENEEEALIALQAALDDPSVAALIVEPRVQGAGGMRMYRAEVLNEMMRLTQSAGALIIFDEVMTGFGRTGELFAAHSVRHEPDIICLSKGITGGMMPLGVTTCTEEIYEAFLSVDKLKTLFHGHSFTGNPLACACANASLSLLLSPECTQARKAIEKDHLAFLSQLQNVPGVEHARVLGTILAFEYASSKEQQSYFHSSRDTLYDAFLERGILLRPLGNTIYILPPYCITKEEREMVYGVISDVLTQLSPKEI